MKLHKFDLLAKWFEEQLTLGGYRPRTIQTYLFELSVFRRWLSDSGEVVDIDTVTRVQIQTFASFLHDNGLSMTTVCHRLTILKIFFQKLYDENKLYRNPAQTIELPRLSRRVAGRILNSEEVEKLFDSLEKQTPRARAMTISEAVKLRDHAAMEVLYSTGIRRGEFLGLRVADIDSRNGMLFIEDGKGGKARMVPVGIAALSALERYVCEGRSILLKGAISDTIFLSRRGNQMNRENIRNIVNNTLQMAGIEGHFRVHDLRHTCATHMLNGGADIRYVQQLLGHSSLNSTQIYTHVSIENLKRSHEKHHPREQWDD